MDTTVELNVGGRYGLLGANGSGTSSICPDWLFIGTTSYPSLLPCIYLLPQANPNFSNV
jgi:hypothetical protein